MRVVISFISGAFGDDIVAISNIEDHISYVARVFAREISDYPNICAFYQKEQNVPGVPKRKNGRDMCYVVYRSVPHGADFVRVQFSPSVTERPPPFKEWVEERDMNHLLGSVRTSAEEMNNSSRSGIGVWPGYSWPGWTSQPKSVTEHPTIIIRNTLKSKR